MSDRTSPIESIRAQAQGMTPDQITRLALHQSAWTAAKKQGAKRVIISSTPQGDLCTDLDFEGLGEVT